MNILPKKRWHVRTRENIARVRRDEAKALEEENLQKERIKLAEREARRELLLKKRRQSSNQILLLDSNKIKDSEKSKHINFFEELEEGTAELKGLNKEHEKEKKEEREKYEKQIGYLTYLGQDTNEALGKKNWYDIAPNRSEIVGEVNLKSKTREDPINIIKKHTQKNYDKDIVASISKVEYTPKKHKNYKKDKKRKRNSSSESSDDEREKREKLQQLQILREKRLKREAEERLRTETLLNKLNPKLSSKPKEEKDFVPKYSSQFNPHLAKQNYT